MQRKQYKLPVIPYRLMGMKFFYLTSYRGALSSMTKYNIKGVDYPLVSLNFVDLHGYAATLQKYQNHLEQKEIDNPKRTHLKRYFNYQDKLVMLTPFPYSADNKERLGGFNDDQLLHLNNREKVYLFML